MRIDELGDLRIRGLRMKGPEVGDRRLDRDHLSLASIILNCS